MNSRECVLRNKDGKVMAVMRTEDDLKLVAKKCQGESAPSVTIFRRGKTRQMALLFHAGNAGYLMKVENTVLRLEEHDTDDVSECISDSHLFEPVKENGQYWSLQTVVPPRQYLSPTPGRPDIFILHDRNDMSAKVKLEWIRASVTH